MYQESVLGFQVSLEKIKDDWSNAWHKHQISYQVITPTGVKFSGDDLFVPGHLDPESYNTTITLLDFICLQPGDTDQEYFDNYSPEQMEWAESFECEETKISLLELTETCN